MRYIVIDDEPTARTQLTALLSGFGRVDEAESAEAGLAMIRQAMIDGDRYAMAYVDLCMPGADGFEVVEGIRELDDEVVDVHTQIVIVTSSDDSDDILRAYRDKADGYLVKPVDPRKLDEIIGRAAAGRGAAK